MNWLAFIWAGISATGVVVSLAALRDIHQDQTALAGRGNGSLRLLLVTRFRREVIRAGALGLFLLAGILTILPGTSDPERVVIYICLYGGTSGLILNGLLEQVDRAMIRRLFPLIPPRK